MEKTLKVGDLVGVGPFGKKGKISNIWKPFGTYSTVHMLKDGSFLNAARHELVKGMPDDDFPNIPGIQENSEPTLTSEASSLPCVTNTSEPSKPTTAKIYPPLHQFINK